jgi:hypothetical protein
MMDDAGHISLQLLQVFIRKYANGGSFVGMGMATTGTMAAIVPKRRRRAPALIQMDFCV